MKLIIITCTFLILLCGCFRESGKFNTLQDYSNTFGKASKTLIKNKTQLTLKEAKQIALANNPTLHAAANSIKAAEYAYYRSLSAWLPDISIYQEVKNSNSRGYELKHPPAGIFPKEERFSTASSIRATWLLFNGLSRELDILISKLEYNRNVAAADDVKRLLIRAVAYTWCDILLSSEEIIIYKADEAFQNAALKQAEQQFKSGHISYATVLNFKVLAAKAKSKIFLAKYNRQTAFNALVSLLGYDSNDLPRNINFLQDPIVSATFDNPLDYYLEQAILNRPDLKAEKLQFEKAVRQKQSVLQIIKAAAENPQFVPIWHMNFQKQGIKCF